MLWQPGHRITAARLNDGLDVTVSSTGATAETGFTLTSFSGRRSGRVITIHVLCQRSGADITETSAGSGNISDTAMATLPADWRPTETITAIWDSGFNDGGATINSAGLITLRTTSGSAGIGTNQNPRVTATWLADS